MPVIEFLGGVLGRDKRVDVPQGGDLLDICDEHYAPVPFSCRSASCATCQIEVLDGAELLEAPEEAERELLSLLDSPANCRLACQARVRAGEGLVRIKPVGT